VLLPPLPCFFFFGSTSVTTPAVLVRHPSGTPLRSFKVLTSFFRGFCAWEEKGSRPVCFLRFTPWWSHQDPLFLRPPGPPSVTSVPIVGFRFFLVLKSPPPLSLVDEMVDRSFRPPENTPETDSFPPWGLVPAPGFSFRRRPLSPRRRNCRRPRRERSSYFLFLQLFFFLETWGFDFLACTLFDSLAEEGRGRCVETFLLFLNFSFSRL